MSNDSINDSPKRRFETATPPVEDAPLEGVDELDELEAEVARKRARMAASLGELRRQVDHVTSWRHWASTYPLTWIAAGLSLGIIIGLGGRNRQR